MRLTRGVVGAGLMGWLLVSGCAKDKEVRTYIRDDLRPYLDSLAYQLCVIKTRTVSTAPGKLICPGPPDGYKPPPPDGSP